MIQIYQKYLIYSFLKNLFKVLIFFFALVIILNLFEEISFSYFRKNMCFVDFKQIYVSYSKRECSCFLGITFGVLFLEKYCFAVGFYFFHSLGKIEKNVFHIYCVLEKFLRTKNIDSFQFCITFLRI